MEEEGRLEHAAVSGTHLASGGMFQWTFKNRDDSILNCSLATV